MSAPLVAAITNNATQTARSTERDVGDSDFADLDDTDGLSADDGVYDEIEALLHDDLPRQGCVELAQALEEVMALLRPALSEFSHPAAGGSPIGRVPVAP
jgi:hypothetical protein